MTSRITDMSEYQGLYQQMLAFGAPLADCSLEHSLLELVKMRASQINGCAYCLAMHARDALQRGERADRLYVLDAWRETDWFTDRERAALAWTEALTTLTNREVPDAVFAQARAQFSERELSDLTLAVLAIISWNRINVAVEAGRRRPVSTVHGRRPMHTLDRFIDQNTVLLTSYKRDGTPVGTPVHIAVEGDHAYVRTYDRAWKYKRILRNPHVEIAPSTVRGTPTGPPTHASARILSGPEAAHAAQSLGRKYPILHRWLIPMVHRLCGYRTVHVRVEPAAP
jgi:PPOX class probable F420-dependent enzyme